MKIHIEAIKICLVVKITNNNLAIILMDLFWGKHLEEEFHPSHEINYDALQKCRLSFSEILRFGKLLQIRRDRAHLNSINFGQNVKILPD